MRMSNIPRLQARNSAKLRSAPARSGASTVYLRMYQLSNEKERLQRELQTLSDRTNQVILSLAELERELATLGSEATRQNIQSEIQVVAVSPRRAYKVRSDSGVNYDGMTIDY
jgi:septum formation inhibitor MinC